MELYKKYRPKKFSDIIGNKGVVEVLSGMLEKKKLPQTILLCGGSGCGKTTIARIIAKEMNCSNYDFHELNIANMRGIDSARAIIEQSKFKAMNGDCRIFLLDEVHMGTTEFFNSLLKTLEDTPQGVHFILCTTNPEKIIKTIRTRCTEFMVEDLDEDELGKLIKRVAKKEGKKVPEEVRSQISKDSLGSARSALVILEKIIDLPTKKMLSSARQSAVNENQVIELCRALMGKPSWKQISGILKGINQEPESARRMILGYFNSVLLNKGDSNIAWIMNCFADNYYDSGKAGLTLSCYNSLNP